MSGDGAGGSLLAGGGWRVGQARSSPSWGELRARGHGAHPAMLRPHPRPRVLPQLQPHVPAPAPRPLPAAEDRG